MDSEKILEARMKMQNLLFAQEELQELPQNGKVGEIVRQIDELIMETAANMMLAYENAPKKSEMACNCCGGCAEEIEEIDAQNKLLQVVEAVDAFTTAISKLANK